MKKTNIVGFHECCREIVKNRDAKALNYCVNYAQAGLAMSDPHEVYVQSLYILNNMTHWRGDVAKRVRQMLKAVPKA